MKSLADVHMTRDGIMFVFPVEITGKIHIEYLNATGTKGLDVKPIIREGFVDIPSDYVYDPAKGSLHDYCTKSPDSFGSADFRGPCARHDMCYERKGCASKSCDNTLYDNLATNCRAAYRRWNPMRATCLATANVYWGAVRGVHIFSACD